MEPITTFYLLLIGAVILLVGSIFSITVSIMSITNYKRTIRILELRIEYLEEELAKHKPKGT